MPAKENGVQSSTISYSNVIGITNETNPKMGLRYRTHYLCLHVTVAQMDKLDLRVMKDRRYKQPNAV